MPTQRIASRRISEEKAMSKDVIEFVPLRQVAKECGKSLSWVYRSIDAGALPKPVRIGPNSVAIIRHELEAAKKRPIELRDAGQAA
jgi:predicted DNA-binding transcriptional regulator AlpA